MDFKHYSVLLPETIEQLHIKEDGIYVDGTLGGGGHSYEIAKRLTTGTPDRYRSGLRCVGSRRRETKTICRPCDFGTQQL